MGCSNSHMGNWSIQNFLNILLQLNVTDANLRGDASLLLARVDRMCFHRIDPWKRDKVGSELTGNMTK